MGNTFITFSVPFSHKPITLTFSEIINPNRKITLVDHREIPFDREDANV